MKQNKLVLIGLGILILLLLVLLIPFNGSSTLSKLLGQATSNEDLSGSTAASQKLAELEKEVAKLEAEKAEKEKVESLSQLRPAEDTTDETPTKPVAEEDEEVLTKPVVEEDEEVPTKPVTEEEPKPVAEEPKPAPVEVVEDFPVTVPTTGCFSFARNLGPGTRDNATQDVSRLQSWLANNSSFYPEGTVSGYYGPATERAVQRFQAANNIVSYGTADTTGYGAVGPKTRVTLEGASCGIVDVTLEPRGDSIVPPSDVLGNKNEDLQILSGCLSQNSLAGCANADFNDDGTVDADDFDLFSGAIMFDHSGDDIVEINNEPDNADIEFVKTCFFGSGSGACSDADYNNDRKVNFLDLQQFILALRFDLSGDSFIDLRIPDDFVVDVPVDDPDPDPDPDPVPDPTPDPAPDPDNTFYYAPVDTTVCQNQSGAKVVGPGEDFDTIEEAFNGTDSGDMIALQPIVYTHSGSQNINDIGHELTICGNGATIEPRTDNTNVAKGLLNTKSNPFDLYIEDVTFRGAKNSDRNGAGIRIQGNQYVTCVDCQFIDNDNGILGNGDLPNMTLHIIDSTFKHNGSNGYSHGIYTGHDGGDLIIEGSTFTDTIRGMHVKQVGDFTVVKNSFFDDWTNEYANDSTNRASRVIELTGGGVALIENNTIYKDSQAENVDVVWYDTSRGGSPGFVTLHGNTIANTKSNGRIIGQPNTDAPFTLRSNTITSVNSVNSLGTGPIEVGNGNTWNGTPIPTTFNDTTPTNLPPTAVITGPNSASLNDLVTLSGLLSSDPEGAVLDYAWRLALKPVGSMTVLSTVADAVTQFVPDLVGAYFIELFVNDGELPSDQALRMVTVSDDDSTPDPNPDPVPMPAPIPPAVGETITELDIVSTDNSTQTNVPITFGQVFVKGHVPSGDGVAARIEGGDGLILQMDDKTRYDDGSLKHAVFSTVMPSLPAGGTKTLELVRTDSPNSGTPISINSLPNSYKADISVNVGGQTYTASADDLLESAAPTYWLQGPVVTEVHYATPLRKSNGVEHPHLTARYHIRVYPNGVSRTDAIVENTTTFVPNIGATNNHSVTIYSNNGIELSQVVNHRHHSRYKDTFWQGDNPEVRVIADMEYLVATKAIPNIDLSVEIRDRDIEDYDEEWETGTGNNSGIARKGIMGVGVAKEAMHTTGGRPDIGILNGWEASYIIYPEARLEKVMYGTAEAAAHWPIHYRDHETDLPVSLTTYPNFTIHPNGGVCNGENNPLPVSNCDLSSNVYPDTAHQPSLNYIPYVLTGDYYQLEELNFWVNWNSFKTAPSNRNYGDAVYTHQQYRAQAWSMRKLSRAAFINPDDHPMKSIYLTRLNNNFENYMSISVDDPNASDFHHLPFYSVNEGNDTISPWQTDFFSLAINEIIHLGFADAEPLYNWLAEYPLMRLNDDEYCWQFATAYRHRERASGSSTYFDNMGDTFIPTMQDNRNHNGSWQAISQAECGTQAMANAAGFDNVGDFTSYRSSLGHLRGALAGAVERNLPGAQIGFDRIQNAVRQPHYYEYPQYSVLPRGVD